MGECKNISPTFVNPLYCSHCGQVQLLDSGYLTHVLLLQNQQLTRHGSVVLKKKQIDIIYRLLIRDYN